MTRYDWHREAAIAVTPRQRAAIKRQTTLSGHRLDRALAGHADLAGWVRARVERIIGQPLPHREEH